MAALVWVASAIASAFLGLLLTILFQDRVEVVLAKLLRGLSVGEARRSFSGDWCTYYEVAPGSAPTLASSPTADVEMIRLKQIGSRVTGTSAYKNGDFVILAALRDGSTLTGEWRNFSDGSYHWGAFQILWLDNGLGMVGKFVGKDSAGHVNHGLWLWARNADRVRKVAEWAATQGGIRLTCQN